MLPRHTRGARMVLRWMAGLVLINWRYLWSVVPLHRTEGPGDASDLPPPLAADYIDEQSQLVDQAAGPLWHRRFDVRIENSPLSPPELITAVANDLNRAAPTEFAVFTKTRGRPGTLAVGDEYVVRMPSPWDGPVRVVRRTDTSFRLATLQGHLESGQVEFRADRDDGALRFTIETWNRSSTRLINFLYAKLRLAKEIQCNMWVRYCQGTAAAAAGRLPGGVTISTRWLTSGW